MTDSDKPHKMWTGKKITLFNLPTQAKVEKVTEANYFTSTIRHKLKKDFVTYIVQSLN